MALSRRSPGSAVPAWLRDNYWVTFRHDVFTLLHLGHARLDRHSLTAAHEEDITGELTRVIEELLDDPHAPEWYSRYGVHEEPRLHSPIRKGKRRQRMDIRIECTDQRPRTHYEFEAKRLCRGKCGCSDYLGPEGLRAFLTGEYAPRWPEAGMLGYVQSDDVSHWEHELATNMAAGPNRLHDGDWQPEPMVTDLFTYRSKHERIAPLESITIYHALLPCHPENSALVDDRDAARKQE